MTRVAPKPGKAGRAAKSENFVINEPGREPFYVHAFHGGGPEHCVDLQANEGVFLIGWVRLFARKVGLYFGGVGFVGRCRRYVVRAVVFVGAVVFVLAVCCFSVVVVTIFVLLLLLLLLFVRQGKYRRGCGAEQGVWG